MASLLAPFERLAIPTAFSGEHGDNRGRDFAFIRAEHDLAAVHANLSRYRDRPPTLYGATKPPTPVAKILACLSIAMKFKAAQRSAFGSKMIGSLE
ncbi:hypothetical protein ACMX25_24390 [Caballeronia sp. 15715]|uniref:hypothetical protein n=1 Tax=Caballeronia sp. 15715 TaxID=3391030 RepID=UPI0039E317CD